MIIRSYDHMIIWSWSYDVFFMIFGCADLRIGLSEAKLDAEVDFDARLSKALQKPDQIDKILIFQSQRFAVKKVGAGK